MAQTIYRKAKVRATFERAAWLVDVNSPGVRIKLHDAIAIVADRPRGLRIEREQFDKSLLTSQHLDISLLYWAFSCETDFDGERPDGIACGRRHDGTNFVFFEGRYVIVEHDAPVRFTPNDSEIASATAELRWDP